MSIAFDAHLERRRSLRRLSINYEEEKNFVHPFKYPPNPSVPDPKNKHHPAGVSPWVPTTLPAERYNELDGRFDASHKYPEPTLPEVHYSEPLRPHPEHTRLPPHPRVVEKPRVIEAHETQLGLMLGGKKRFDAQKTSL